MSNICPQESVDGEVSTGMVEGGEEEHRSRTVRHPFRPAVKKLSEITFYIAVTDATFPKLVVNKNKN